MKLYLAHEEHMIPDAKNKVQVIVLAGNAGIQHFAQGNCPEATQDLYDWFQANCKDNVYMGHYDPVQAGSTEDPLFAHVDHFVVPFWFEDVNQAMIFKLTWGGV